MKKGIIYGRVSTALQDYTRQVSQLKQFAECNNIKIMQVFTEQVTGSKKAANREALSGAMDYIRNNDIDIVLVHELSRLGRDAFDVQSTINSIVNECRKDLYLYDYQMYALGRDGLMNPFFKIVTDVLASVAELERNHLIKRIRSGIKSAKSKGVKLGRRPGTTKDITETKNYKKVMKLIKSNNNLGLRKIAKICDVSPNTVKKVKDYYLKHDC